MDFKNILGTFLLIYSCKAYIHNERYVSNENLTVFDILTKMAQIDDLIIPNIDFEERDYLKTLVPKILQYQKPFLLSGDSVSEKCRRDSTKFLSSLKKLDLWALRMYDASAKISSGILNGNVNRYGDYDECLSVVAENEEYQGKYCLAYIQPTVTPDFKYLNYLRTLSLAFEAYKSEFDHERHVIPKTSQIQFALCIPSTCSHKELEIVLKENLANFFNSTQVNMDVRVEEDMCQVKDDKKPYSLGNKIAIYFFTIIVVISIFSTFYDSPRKANKNEWLTAFSLRKNWNEMVTTKASNDIESAHGIRFFNTVMLIISHKCMEVDFNPIPNRIDIGLISQSPVTVIVRASYLYTDAFIMLSAMLISYSFIGRLQKNVSINIIKEIAARYFRVVPPMAALMLFGTFILPIIVDGPQWGMLINNQAEICKQNWWRNFLMIHNWFGFENICMTHTHHIGTDFELFLFAPIIIILLHKYPKKMSLVIFILATLSTVGRFYTTYVRDVTVYVLYGVEVSKLYEVASYMYILPIYRFTTYAMGIMLGYILRNSKNIKLTSTQLTAGWFIVSALFIITALLTAFMSAYDYTFNSFDAALFSSVAPIPFCLFFAWMIYTGHLGYKNAFLRVFEWKGFLISTKLSYGIYLVQFAVFHFNISKVRNSIHFGIFKSVINTNEILCIVAAAAVMTLFFDLPFGNLKKIIFDTKKQATSQPTMVKKELNVDVNANEIIDQKKVE